MRAKLPWLMLNKGVGNKEALGLITEARRIQIVYLPDIISYGMQLSYALGIG